MEKMTDRRRSENMLKAVILPIVVAVVTGIGASYIATQVTVAVIEKQVEYIESDLISIKELLEKVTENQTELARRSVWMQTKNEKDREQDQRIGNLEATVYHSP